MIIVDSSVWIDYFNGRTTPQTVKLDGLLGEQLLAIGDLILTEVLQGFRSDSDYQQARRVLEAFPTFSMVGQANAIRSAEHYRLLRRKGITVRKTMDVLIATFCIEQGHQLLFTDRDFLPFVEHLGLRGIL